MRSLVVTGVSSGIGHAITKELINNGVSVFGSVRNEKDGTRLASEFGQLFQPLYFDVIDETAVQQAAKVVREKLKGQRLWGLINNAGIVVPGPLMELSLAEYRRQFEVNVFGQISVTQAFVPLLGADPNMQGQPGKIINISSVSGKFVYPFFGAYAMSKFSMEAFSDALRMELNLFGIDVVVIGPGMVQSQIWEKGEQDIQDKEQKPSVYPDALVGLKKYMLDAVAKQALPAEVIATLAMQILTNAHPKPRYAPVPSKFINYTLPRLLPRRWLDKIMTNRLKLKREK